MNDIKIIKNPLSDFTRLIITFSWWTLNCLKVTLFFLCFGNSSNTLGGEKKGR